MNPPPRIVIVGAAGRLGQALVQRLSPHATVIGLARPAIDLSDPLSIVAALEPLDFDHLILPAAMTAVDPCEADQDKAYAINATAPGIIAKICVTKRARMTHVSTDFVFDGGKIGPYTEADATLPVSVYGESKLMGEHLVMAASPLHLVVRVSWLYGPGKPAFPEWIVDKAFSESTLSLPADKIGSPTSATDAADLLVPLLESSASGIYHLCNAGSCTWQQWGQACLDIAREAGLPLKCTTISGNSLADIPAFLAKRPPNSAMSTEKYTTLTGITPRPWLEALREHFATSSYMEKYLAAACD
ncbi:dTDP-4-dehydrorhamnose reductase [Luteolibacter flavescens]|uniref:dTDP-4-dehydrorhamnose reductase n=1 Tax=Luteolibacter flavescens TaxID=1859460 RepID=A0ABT3FSZ2_9BACT|nr:dTDP-4-dehydrorhamnose reductase [Luteolibacter flavescens]MCW1886356.1 dTDP-4-dehydrorhamnose reductase [Luteolibacter flavescens]